MSIARRPRPRRAPADRPLRRRPSRHPRPSRRARLGAGWRRWLARAPVGPVLLAVAAALVAVSLRVAPADLALDPAEAVAVVVATVDLVPGTVVDPDDIEVRPLAPEALPRTTATTPDQVVGHQVIATILAGEPVVGTRLAPDGLVGVAAATPPSWSAFALPTDTGTPDVAVGQAVDVYALDTGADPSASAGEALLVASDAVVVAADDGPMTVAVRAREAPTLAAALLGSRVVVAVTAPGVASGDRAGSGGRAGGADQP